MEYCTSRDIALKLSRKRMFWLGKIKFSVKGEPGSFGSINFIWPDNDKVSFKIYIPKKEKAKNIIESRIQYAIDNFKEIMDMEI